MDIVLTDGRKSLLLDEWVKPEISQGVSNCWMCRLRASGVVDMGDTQTKSVIGGMPGGEWAAFVKAAA